MTAPTTPRPYSTDRSAAPGARLRIPTTLWVVIAFAVAALILMGIAQIITATEMLDMMALIRRNNG